MMRCFQAAQKPQKKKMIKMCSLLAKTSSEASSTIYRPEILESQFYKYLQHETAPVFIVIVMVFHVLFLVCTAFGIENSTVSLAAIYSHVPCPARGQPRSAVSALTSCEEPDALNSGERRVFDAGKEVGWFISMYVHVYNLSLSLCLSLFRNVCFDEVLTVL